MQIFTKNLLILSFGKTIFSLKYFLKNALSIVLLIVVSALVVFLFIKDDMDGLLVALKQTKWISTKY